MNFLPYANLLEQVFVVLSGLVYLLPLQKREPIEVRFLSGLIMGGALMVGPAVRSEERRVGKECRSRWSPYH